MDWFRETGIPLFFVVLAVFLSTYFTSVVGLTQNRVYALWPAAGISLWACWRYGIPGAVATFLGYSILTLFTDSPLIINFGNALVAWISSLIIKTKCKFTDNSDISDLAWILAAGFVLSCLSAGFGGPYIANLFNLDLYAGIGVTLRWFMADMAGIVLFAPLLFACSHNYHLEVDDFVGYELVLAALSCCVLAIAILVFPWSLSLSAKALIISSPFIFFVITRDHTLKVLTAYSFVGFVVLCLVAYQLNNDNITLLETQLFLLTFMTCAMFIHHMLIGAKQARDLLEQRVEERTAQLAKATVAAEAADESKSKFLANTSHELRTPLNGILGMARTLRKQGLGAENDQRVQTIVSCGENLLSLLDDVIDLSKIDAEQLEISRISTNLNTLASDTENLWRDLAEQNGCVFRLKNHIQESEWFLVDPHRLKQCINNLISNAVKFSNKGSVNVALRYTENRQLEVEVQDTGIGIKEENLARLFLPFDQIDSSIARKFGGTGLGLNITKRLIELMDGQIRVRSEFGLGSTFCFRIPAEISEAAEQDMAFEIEMTKLDGLRALVVEDNEINRMVIADLLDNIEIDEAEHGAKALEMLADNEYDLVLLDIQMPVMDGIETIKNIRNSTESWANIPVVALTANAMSEDRTELLGIGMDGYASKPIDPPVLIKEMLNALAGRN